MPALIWTILSLGLMAFACGAMLLGWSMVTGRQDLNAYGVPITLGGLAALLMGLILQIDRIGSEHRRAVDGLQPIEPRSPDTHGIALPGTHHSTGGAASCVPLPGSAKSQLLLAQLKGRLDLLTLQMAQESA